MALESACDVACVRSLFTLFKSLVKVLVNIQYLSYLHQDLEFSCSLMEFKDLHSSAELPWKQSSPGCFFFSLSVTGDTADQSSESSKAETGNAPPHNLHREKPPVSQLVLEYTHNYSSVAGRSGRYWTRTHTELDLLISASIYEHCRNCVTQVSIPLLYTFAFAIRFANLAK